MESEIIGLLEQRGPLTGAELCHALAGDSFSVWKACMLSGRIAVRQVGRRYLRLDENVEGYARLSPSILREFLTYTAVGLTDDPGALDRRTAEIAAHIQEVTESKLQLARTLVDGIAARLPGSDGREDRFCVLLAGDIVYEMAHDVPRPERSTGRMVKGSDLDLVVIVDDRAQEVVLEAWDEAIYKQKYRYLINPSVREEIDYIVKRFERLREQAEFDSLKKMIACKILRESVLLHGSPALFGAAKALLDEYGVTQRLEAMERSAVEDRRAAEAHLLSRAQDSLSGDELYLFYTSDESEEFE